MPKVKSRRQFIKWIAEKFPDQIQLPAWLSLPNDVDKVLLTTRGSEMMTQLLKTQLLEDDDDDEAGEVDRAASQGRPAWMRSLLDSAGTWLGLLPNSLVSLRRTGENIKDPLYRFFEREFNTGYKLLQDVRKDLSGVQLICKVINLIPLFIVLHLMSFIFYFTG